MKYSKVHIVFTYLQALKRNIFIHKKPNRDFLKGLSINGQKQGSEGACE